MKFHKLKLVTVIADSAIARQIESKMQTMGAKEITKTDVNDDKVQLQSTVSPSISTEIIQYVCAEAFENHAVIAYAVEMNVSQPEKFKLGLQQTIS